jgi:hypothetical protein
MIIENDEDIRNQSVAETYSPIEANLSETESQIELLPVGTTAV